MVEVPFRKLILILRLLSGQKPAQRCGQEERIVPIGDRGREPEEKKDRRELLVISDLNSVQLKVQVRIDSPPAHYMLAAPPMPENIFNLHNLSQEILAYFSGIASIF